MLKSKALSQRLTSLKQSLAEQLVEQSLSPKRPTQVVHVAELATDERQAAAAVAGSETGSQLPGWIEHGLPSSAGQLPSLGYSPAPLPAPLASPSPVRSSVGALRWPSDEPSPAARLEARMSSWAMQGPSTTLVERKLALADMGATEALQPPCPSAPSREPGSLPARRRPADEFAPAKQEGPEASPLPGSALANGNSMRLVKQILAADAARREAVWGSYIAKISHRRVRKAWGICERLHAATLSRLREVEEQLEELAHKDGHLLTTAWAASSENASVGSERQRSSPWVDNRLRLKQIQAELDEERQRHQEERAVAQARHAKLFKDRAEAQTFLASLRAASATPTMQTLGGGSRNTALLAARALLTSAPEVAERHAQKPQ